MSLQTTESVHAAVFGDTPPLEPGSSGQSAAPKRSAGLSVCCTSVLGGVLFKTKKRHGRSQPPDELLTPRPPRFVEALRGSTVEYRAHTVITMESEYDELPGHERPNSITTAQGMILSVDRSAASSLLSPPSSSSSTTVVDFAQMFSPSAVIVPGLIESHMHPLLFADAIRLLNLQNPPLQTRQQVMEALQRRRDELLSASDEKRALIGWGFDAAMMTDDARPPTRQELDALFTDRPVFVYHASMHIAYVNTFLLRKATGAAFDERRLPGDQYVLDGSGEYTGEVREAAALLPVLHALGTRSFDELLRVAHAGLVDLRHRGWTTVCDAFAGANPLDYHVYQALMAGGESFPLRVMLYPGVASLQQAQSAAAFHTGFGNERLKLGPKKYVLDGSLQGRTGHVKAPYLPCAVDPDPCNTGVAAYADQLDELRRQWQKDHQLGYQLAVHVNGDAAAETALDLLESVIGGDGQRGDHRHRFEHCQMLSDQSLDRVQRLGVHLSFFPSHTLYWGDLHVRYLGAERAHSMCRIKSAAERGIPFSLHSDAPVTVPDPLLMMYCACTRRCRSGARLGEHERITAAQALRAITIDAARLIFEERSRGSIRPGKLADFTVLSADPTACDPERLLDIRVLGVVLDGHWRPAKPPVHFPRPTVDHDATPQKHSLADSSSSIEIDTKRSRRV